MINTLSVTDTDFMNVTKWTVGSTLQRLSRVPESTIKQIIERGGQARWDGEIDFGCGAVWIKYEAVALQGRAIKLINHSLNISYEFSSMAAAKEFIRYT